jgi:hypothetical protein
MEYTKQRILTAVRVILFLFFCGLVMHGQRSVSCANLGEMAAGLVGMLVIIWDYNRRNR